MNVSFVFNGQRMHARQGISEQRMAAVARSIARRVGADVTLEYDHARTLDRVDGREVHTAKWYDTTSEVFCERDVEVLR